MAEKLLAKAEKKRCDEASFFTMSDALVDRFRFVTSLDGPNAASEAQGFRTGMKRRNIGSTTTAAAAVGQAVRLPLHPIGPMGVQPRHVSWAIADQVPSGSSSSTTSPSQARRASSPQRTSSQLPSSPPAHQRRHTCSSGTSSSPTAPAILQKQLLNLGAEAKLILREAVLSAILHPKGEVDPRMLRRAISKGLPRRAVLNAAALARSRNGRERDCARSRMERQLLSLRTGGSASGGGGRRRRNDNECDCATS